MCHNLFFLAAMYLSRQKINVWLLSFQTIKAVLNVTTRMTRCRRLSSKCQTLCLQASTVQYQVLQTRLLER